MTPALIDIAELKTLIGQPRVKIFDASYNHPPTDKGIPDAQDFDIDDIADPDAPFAHTVPSPDLFAEKMRALGVNNDDLVIIYDRSGIAMSAARAWWMFRLYGHDNVRVLNGGLNAWMNSGGEIGRKQSRGGMLDKLLSRPAPAQSDYKASFRPELLKLKNDIEANLAAHTFTVLDARDNVRFRGAAPDPRPNVGTGHIPGAINIPFATLITPEGYLKDREQLKALFQASGVNLQNSLACSCGSGVTACVIALALYELGYPGAAVYDGSWTEWGSDPALPKAQGE